MVFSSLEFLLYFLPIFMVVYGLTPRKYRNVTLLMGSLVFYGFGELKFIGLLVASLVINYLLGLELTPGRRKTKHKDNRRRGLLVWAIVGNVAVLALFKGAPDSVGLPLGISFYTFRILSYLIDVYHGEISKETSLIRLGAYVTMFPHLLSGPITYYGEVKEQLDDGRITAAGIQDGLKIFTMGLASKVLLADRIGLLWKQVQTTGFESISTPLAWLGAVAYSMEIYFDFYGYSLMARGLGRMLGFELPENFREPYLARGVTDFYRRWHMTLGRWFKKYVYIPLGGNRKGQMRTVLHLFMVWILTSVWHGTTANFLVWGMLLFACILLEKWLDRFAFYQKMQILPRLYLWVVIPVSWMCFAIPDISQLKIYLGRMFGVMEGFNVNRSDWIRALGDYKWLFPLCIVSCTPLVRKWFRFGKERLLGQIALGVLFWICVVRLMAAGDNPFMYFRF